MVYNGMGKGREGECGRSPGTISERSSERAILCLLLYDTSDVARKER
jgi:hypothetical protein